MVGSSPAMTEQDGPHPPEPKRPWLTPMLAISHSPSNTDMTMAEITAPTTLPPAPAPRLLGLRILLIIVAVLEALDGLSSATTLLGDMSEIPGPGIGGAIIKLHLATHPVLALAALLLAAVGRVRHAIIALGAIMVMTWLNYMPSVVLHGLDFGGVGAILTPAQIIAFPLMGACAIAYAARNQRLGIATLLVCIPTLFNVFGVIAFAVGVALHGF